MKKERLAIKKAFSLVELMVAISIFMILVFLISNISILPLQQIREFSDRERAAGLAEEALEIVRALRDDNFSNLADGSHGIENFQLSGSSDVVDIFTRTVTISNFPGYADVESTVSWAGGSVSLQTRFTDWRKVTCGDQADILDVDASNFSFVGNNQLTGIVLTNTSESCDVVIDRIIISWTSPGRRLNTIQIDGDTVWSGSVASGNINDIEDYTLLPEDSVVNNFIFSGNISSSLFTIDYIMSDETAVTVSGINE